QAGDLVADAGVADDRFADGHDEQRHGDGEDAVAQRRETVELEIRTAPLVLPGPPASTRPAHRHGPIFAGRRRRAWVALAVGLGLGLGPAGVAHGSGLEEQAALG